MSSTSASSLPVHPEDTTDTLPDMKDHQTLLQSFSRLEISKSPQTGQGNGSKAVSNESTRPSRMSVQHHAFQPQIQCLDLSDKFTTLRLSAEKDNESYTERSPLLRRRSSSETLSARDRIYRINGLASQREPADLRRQWLGSTKASDRPPSDAGPSSPLSSGSVSPDLVRGLSSTEANRRFQVEAQNRWEASRRKRHSMSGYPSKEQYWTRKISKAEVAIENLRKSHREAQRISKRKGKMVEVDQNDDNDSENEAL